MMMQFVRNEVRAGDVTETQTGLAAWLLAWFQTPLWNRLAGMGKVRDERRMELVETLQLGGKRQLMLVVCDGRRYLVGGGSDSVHSIAEMTLQSLVSDEPLGVSSIAMQHSEHGMKCGQ